MAMRRLALVLFAIATGCHTTPAGPDFVSSPEAQRIAEAWLAQTQGFDALEAYELRGFQFPIRFAVARKWVGEGVRVLSYLVEPGQGVAFLLIREPGDLGNLFMRIPPAPNARGNVPTVRQMRALRRPGGSDEVSVGSEVAQPLLPSDFVHRQRPDTEVEGELCAVVESHLQHPTRFFTHQVAYISKRTSVALRVVYYKGDRELRRVTVAPEDVEDFGGRALPRRRVITMAGGGTAEIVLENVLVEVELPESLFSLQKLEAERFPRF